ncbi:MAG: TraB/GumN family protein [Polyangiaceae bacterium]|nr:TraB/GumN family protein [Polyangiaceae bacterium]
MAEPGHVTRIDIEGREIHIVATAHVSRRSVEEVERVIDDVRPDTVCVELDLTRYESLIDDQRWAKLNLFDVIRERRAAYLLTSIVLVAYQRRIGKRLGVEPGAELRAAVRKAAEVHAELVLADRDIQATLRRSWANLSRTEKLKLVELLAVAPFVGEEQVDEEQVERLKDRDGFNEMLAELARQMPGLKAPLLDERDSYLMSTIAEAPGQRIVAVVGAGHVQGMLANVGRRVDREALSRLPPPSTLKRVLRWLVPLVVFGASYLAYRERQLDGLLRMLMAWAAPVALLSAVVTAMAGGRIPSVLTALVVSPVTALSPVRVTGMVVGLLEARLRRPTLVDCQRVYDDVATLRGIYRNPLTRVLLVTLAAGLGSALGAYVGIAWMLVALW